MGALLGFILLAGDLTPNWLRTPLALYMFIAISLVTFQIGYELGVRAPTDFHTFRSMLFDPLPTRLRKFIIHSGSLGLSERRSQLDDNGFRAKSRLDAERNNVRKNLDKREGSTN